MKLERKHAVLFLLIAAWNVLTYANFAKNLKEAAVSGENRPSAYYIAHIVLIVVNMVIAAFLGRLGWKAWRGPSSEQSESTPALR